MLLGRCYQATATWGDAPFGLRNDPTKMSAYLDVREGVRKGLAKGLRKDVGNELCLPHTSKSTTRHPTRTRINKILG